MAFSRCSMIKTCFPLIHMRKQTFWIYRNENSERVVFVELFLA